jgi:uncharacterized membrane-anchored protein
MTIDPDRAAAIALIAFAGLSFVDGVVLHLWRERLHLRATARLEHLLHSARAVLFPAILAAFFAGQAPVVGIVLLALDQAVEGWDMAVERRSRAYSGGLRSSEYVLHGLLITLRAFAIGFALFASPAGSGDLAAAVGLLLPGAVAVALLHVTLAIAPAILRQTVPEQLA